MRTKLLFTAFFFVGIFNVFSQEYHPFLNNSSWSVEKNNFGTITTYSILPGINTVIGGQTYSKIFDSVNNEDVYIREDVDARKLYRLVNGIETILYDFGIELGQTITLNDGNEYTVEGVSTTNVNGGQRKRIYLAHHIGGQLTYFETWIEGIGSPTQPLKPNYELFSDPVFRIVCSAQNGQMIYNWGIAWNGTATSCELQLSDKEFKLSTNEFSLSPNPFKSQLNVHSSIPLANTKINIYNALGQSIREIKNISGQDFTIDRENLQSGVYFLQIVDEDHLITKKIIVSD